LESGDDHAQHRDYNSNPYRWLTPDPEGKDVVHLDDPQSWNMYMYSHDNPVTDNDPTGLQEQPDRGPVGGDASPRGGEGRAPCTLSPSREPCGDQPTAKDQSKTQTQQNQAKDQPRQPERSKQPSWDPSKPLPDDPSKLGPDWKKNPDHKDPSGEEYVNDKTGEKLEWNKGRPGKPGWRGKDHWHHTPPGGERSGHQRPGETIKRYAPAAVGLGVALGVVQTIIETAPEWLPVVVGAL
jgi:RHS repeat-associated protein